MKGLTLFVATMCVARAFLTPTVRRMTSSSRAAAKYTIPDQPARFAKAKAEKNVRVLDLESIYDPAVVKGKTVLVTGCNRGIGLALAKELISVGANVIGTSRAPFDLPGSKQVIAGMEMTDNKVGEKLAAALNGQNVDILINNAGYFYGPVEKLDTLALEEELKMIDICALGPLRVTSGLANAGLLPSGSKVAIISSQGGSIEWRTTQNPEGQDYGHHMSKAAANMCGRLLSQELKGKGVCVTLLHPGFNKTDMTSKYAHIWEIEGAVDASIGARRVIHEVARMYSEEEHMQGAFINCEDGLNIPW